MWALRLCGEAEVESSVSVGVAQGGQEITVTPHGSLATDTLTLGKVDGPQGWHWPKQGQTSLCICSTLLGMPCAAHPRETMCSGLCSPSHIERTVLEASVIMSPGLVD